MDARILADLGFCGVDPQATGRPVCHPSVLLKLTSWLSQPSARRAAGWSLGWAQVEVMWLTGRLAPEVERMNRTLREATVRRYHCDSHDQLRQHLGPFPLRLQLRQAPQDIEGAHALRSHLRGSDEEARLQLDPTQFTPGTTQITCVSIHPKKRSLVPSCARLLARRPQAENLFPGFPRPRSWDGRVATCLFSCLRLLQAIDTA